MKGSWFGCAVGRIRDSVLAGILRGDGGVGRGMVREGYSGGVGLVEAIVLCCLRRENNRLLVWWKG